MDHASSHANRTGQFVRQLPESSFVIREFLAALAVPRAAAKRELLPEPHGADVIGIDRELRSYQRFPYHLERAFSAFGLEPLPDAQVLDRLPIADRVDLEHEQAESNAVDERKRREAEQVERRGKSP